MKLKIILVERYPYNADCEVYREIPNWQLRRGDLWDAIKSAEEEIAYRNPVAREQLKKPKK